MQQQPPQRSLYILQVRERVVHMVKVLGYSYQQVSAVFSGRPNNRTGAKRMLLLLLQRGTSDQGPH